MKIAINTCFGGFGLSHKAHKRYAELKGLNLYCFKEKRINEVADWGHFVPCDNPNDELFVHYATKPLNPDGTYDEDSYLCLRGHECRTDPAVIQTIEELGNEANSKFSELKIVEIPDSTEYEIDDYDGVETVHEVHRSWS